MRNIKELTDAIAYLAYEREKTIQTSKTEPEPVRRDMLKLDMSYQRWLRAQAG